MKNLRIGQSIEGSSDFFFEMEQLQEEIESKLKQIGINGYLNFFNANNMQDMFDSVKGFLGGNLSLLDKMEEVQKIYQELTDKIKLDGGIISMETISRFVEIANNFNNILEEALKTQTNIGNNIFGNITGPTGELNIEQTEKYGYGMFKPTLKPYSDKPY